MKQPLATLDGMVRRTLSGWRQLPPGLEDSGRSHQGWLRARPHMGTATYQPFLKLPGSRQMRTLPDGLWLYFGGKPAEIFVDIFGIM